MCEYSPSPQKPLQEVEVFVGSILGKDGAAPSKRVREKAGTVRDRYDELVRYTIETILRGDDVEPLDDDLNAVTGDEALERTIACLSTAVTPDISDAMNAMSLGSFMPGAQTKAPRVAPKASLQSWNYLTMVLCLRQVDRFCSENGIASL